MDEFDKLVLQNATGESLERWNNVRDNYDKSLIVDQVIMAVEGVVAIVGFAVSVIGAFAGGIGFFAGMGITADILLLLGAIGAIYDIINGAIQRSKLRDAINDLVPARLKAKYVQLQIDQLRTSLPTIQTLYQMFDEMGYDKEKILQKFKDRHYIESLKSKAEKITYTSTGEVLVSLDSSRDAWTNEDPYWRPIASVLDSQHSAVPAMMMMAAPVAGLAISNTLVGASAIALAAETGVPHDSELHIRFGKGGEATEILSQSYHVLLKAFEGDHHARSHLHTEGGKQALVADTNAKSVRLVPVSRETTDWILSFVNPDDETAFATHGKDFDLSRRPTSATIYVQVGDLYLTTDGTLISDKNQASAKLTASYA